MDLEESKAELASLASSLRAYLEQQQATGAVGIPRAAKRAPLARELSVAAPPVEVPPILQPERPPALEAQPAVGAPAKGPVPTALPLHSFPEPVVQAVAERTKRPAAPPPTQVIPQVSADPVERRARLTVLEQTVASCQSCVLGSTRKNTVFSRGNPSASLCFVGEAPGADEDEQGRPFVGRAGQLLDKMIGAMGLDPEKDVYICNIIKCRPPENRRPTPEESAACMPYLQEQLALVQPKVMVALGNTAVAALLNTKLGITKLRGQWKLYAGQTMLMPTYHPSYLLRPSAQQAQAKREAWEDLQLVMRELGLAAARPGA